MTRARYKLVDLFCGCGGISRGFAWTQRFGTQFGVELAGHPASAFATNIRNVDGEPVRVYTGDLTKLVGNKELLRAELTRADINRPGEIDVLAGGPPCQGFSRNGVRLYEDRDKGQRFYDSPKNHLYRSFLEFVKITSPKIVLVENVREFLNFGNGKFSADLVSRFNELGYTVEHKKLCAADFGVPQMRHRVFFVAIRSDLVDRRCIGPAFPEPEYMEAPLPLGFGQTYHTVRDAIFDLPTPTYSKSEPLTYPPANAVSGLALQLRNPRGVVFNHFARRLSEQQVKRINAVGVGRMKEIDPNLRTKAYYGSAYRRLSWDEPALTITTWVYHVGSGRYAHPEADRGITMREAARLQTFDDAFVFPPLVNPVSQMIGNAVPPLLASKFAQRFVSILDGQ